MTCRVLVTILLTVVVTLVLDRLVNFLPDRRRRHRTVRPIVLGAVSAAALSSLQVLWEFTEELFGSQGLVVLIAIGAVALLAAALVETALRQGGVQPSMDKSMWDELWTEWRSMESLRSADYVTAEFHRAYLYHCARFKVRILDGVHYPTASESGPITLTDGLRTTLPSTGNPKRRLMVFGGSTTFCAEVPNELTWPSLLQELLNADGTLLAVENHGFGGATMLSLTPHVTASNPRDGDAIVFYIGVNEMAYMLVSRISDRRGIARLSLVEKALQVLSERLALGLWIRRATIRDRWKINASGLISLNRVVDEIADECHSLGVSIHFVLQPWILDRSRLSAGDRTILKRYSASQMDAFTQGMKILRESLSRRTDVHTAAEIFNEEAITPFIDLVHVNARGNQLIARYVHNVLRDSSVISH